MNLRSLQSLFAHYRVLTLLLVLLSVLAGCRSQGDFHSTGQIASPGSSFIGMPQLVTLPDLAANPLLYQDKYIRVSGNYVPADSLFSCVLNVRGPAGRWFLADDTWRLEVSGYEGVIPSLEPGTNMTIDGIFTYYDGPLGCGKDAARNTLWYLDVVHIVEPNPLPLLAAGGTGSGGALFNGGNDVSAGGTITSTVQVSETPEESGTQPPEVNPTVETPTLSATTPTATNPAGTVPATVTTPQLTTTPPSPTATPTATPSLTPDPASSATPGGPPTTTPPSPSPTPPDGYPPPQTSVPPSPYP